jgi:hypothetical protein
MSTGKIYFALKNLNKTIVVVFVLFSFSWATQNTVSAQQGYISTQVFYDQLSPYGQWVDNPDYGYVWIPDVDQDFSPYSTSGYWVMTEYGWTWVSDYPWGWAPFHYGRWDYDNNYGWYWVPDNEWGPSWVTWRSGNGYYGWTPMRPGISVSLSFGNDYHDVDHWNFVRESDFGRRDMYHYYANRNQYNTIIINSTVINNTYVDRSRNTTYIAGPSRNDVQRVTGRKVSNVAIRDYDRPGQKLNRSQMQIYRPQIQQNNDRGQKPAPTRITSREDVRPVRDRNRPDQQGKASPTQNNNREQQQPQPQRQKQAEDQRQSQPAQQTEKQKQNQDQRQQPQQQQEQRRQEQNQVERQNQQKQKQQINNQIQEQAKQQNQRSQQQAEKRNQEKQRQVQQQQQQQERSNQEKQVKQQNEQQRQVQQQQQQQERRNQEQQVKQQKNQQRQAQQQKQSEQKQERKTQEKQKQNTTNPTNNGNDRQQNATDSPEKQKRN